MDQDNPESLVHELMVHNFWSGHPLGRADSRNSGNSWRFFANASVMECIRNGTSPKNMLVTAAGNIEHAHLVEFVAQ